jgi:hypothetical protein
MKDWEDYEGAIDDYDRRSRSIRLTRVSMRAVVINLRKGKWGKK